MCVSNCGCDAPKYSGGWCYGFWAGYGCLTRGELWDTDRCGNIIIKYRNEGIYLEVKTPKETLHYTVKPRIPVEELKKKFAEFRDQHFGVYVDEDKLVIRTYARDEVVADLESPVRYHEQH